MLWEQNELELYSLSLSISLSLSLLFDLEEMKFWEISAGVYGQQGFWALNRYHFLLPWIYGYGFTKSLLVLEDSYSFWDL